MHPRILPARPVWFDRYQYTILFATLLLVYSIRPFIGQREIIFVLVQVATLLMLLAAVATFRKARILFIAAVTLGIVGILFTSTGADSGPMWWLGRVFDIAFILVVSVAIFARVAKMNQVTMNTVFGVCAVYLMMTLGWSFVYELLDYFDPSSFHSPSPSPEILARYGQFDTRNDLLYFSLITTTTVGYGDIVPMTPPARTLAALQGFIGQIFLAIFLARIVSMEVSNRLSRQDHHEDG